MVTKTQKSGKRTDYLFLPAFLGFLACVGWVGYDLFEALTYRAEMVTRVNAAVDRHNSGAPGAALPVG